jgi:AcrR family transcriptional regulator
MTPSQKTGSYHHGQLRRALLDAALHLVEHEGLAGLTLRNVARQAGVSHAAPYHHFANKAALIEALATECFVRFGEALQSAAANPGTAREKFFAVGMAYVTFALEQRAAFRLMTRPELRHALEPLPHTQDPPGLEEHAPALSFRVLIDSVRLCQAEGAMPPGDPLPLALTAWATMHGLALLLLDGGMLSMPLTQAGAPDALVALVTERLWNGLLVR